MRIPSAPCSVSTIFNFDLSNNLENVMSGRAHLINKVVDIKS